MDKVRGTVDFYDVNWMGFEQNDCEAVIDLRSAKPITKVVVGCLQNQGSWIFFPKAIEVSVSKDSAEFKSVGRIDAGEPRQDQEVTTKDFSVTFASVTARFVKVKVTNVGVCPAWHNGAGGKAWVFLDEITIK
jgi:hypothetical protein